MTSSVTPSVAQPAPINTNANQHVVVPGDTLWSIARAYGVSLSALRRLNGLSTNASIQAGRKLIVRATAVAPESAPAPVPDKPAARTVAYRVKKGDTYFSLSKMHGCSVASLQQLNDKAPLLSGATIKVPAPAALPPKKPAVSALETGVATGSLGRTDD